MEVFIRIKSLVGAYPVVIDAKLYNAWRSRTKKHECKHGSNNKYGKKRILKINGRGASKNRNENSDNIPPFFFWTVRIFRSAPCNNFLACHMLCSIAN